MCFSQAIAYGNGNMKKQDFDKLIDKLTTKKKKKRITLEQSGIPFEEG